MLLPISNLSHLAAPFFSYRAVLVKSSRSASISLFNALVRGQPLNSQNLASRNYRYHYYMVWNISGVARICCEEGQSLKLGHGALTVDIRAGCSSCSMTYCFVTNAVLIERAVSCWHLHQLLSQTTQYLDSWQSDSL